MNPQPGEGPCIHCGVDAIFWPPPRLMHDPGMDLSGHTELYRYCRLTAAEVAQ